MKHCFTRLFLISALTTLLFVLSYGKVSAQVSSLPPTNGNSYVVAAYVNNKYYALPNTTTNGGTLSGVEVTLNTLDKVSTSNASGKTWILEEGSGDNSGMYYLKYTSGNNTYYLYKNGTGGSNYNFKVSSTDKNFWSFSSNGKGYTVAAVGRGNNNPNIQCNSGTFRCYTTATPIILLEIGDVPNFTISAVSNNSSYGNVSLSGTTITATPNTGYRVSLTNPYIVTSGTATVIQNDNLFSVTPSSNCVVTINFEAIPTHTATFSVNGIATSQDYLENEAITFPDNPSDINGKTFVGWVSSTIVEPTDEVPTFVTSATMGSSDITFYAVFANSEFGSPIETKAQTLQYDDWSYHGDTSDKDSYRLFGDGSYIESALFDLSKLSKVIVYGGTYGGSSFNSLTIGDGINVWKSGTVSGSSNTGTNTFTDGTTLSGTKKLRITATAGNGTATGLRISKVEIFVTTLSVVYSQYCTTVELAAVETPVITVDEQFSFSTAVEISCSTEGAIIYYTTDGTTPSSSSTEYTGEFNINSTCTIKAIAIKGSDVSLLAYANSTKVLVEPTVIIEANGIYNRNLHFGTSAGSLAASVLYNNEAIDGASVTWSGNNDNVATIDENTGVVTLKAVGSVIFTASYEGSSDFDEKTDTYEMTVIQVDPSEATILFGSAVGSTSIKDNSITGNDSFNNKWTITTVGTSSFTPNASYAQVGSSSSPATSITFTTSLNEDVKISSITAKFGGFSGTAGSIVLKVGDTTVGSGSLNGTSDVTVSSTSAAAGNELTVTVTGISKGVKCYYITYTIESIIAMPFEGRYWSSFYNSSTSYKLPVGAQAFTMHSDNKLYLLGEDGSIIPSGTAVIIMADKASIALTECTSSLSDPGNILEGANSSFTIPDGKVAFVLGIAGSPASIGFFKYSGSSIPAGKAYILADE